MIEGMNSNATLDWSANVTLTVGENLITVVATDGEGLTTTATVPVCYEPLKGDLNADGILDSADAAIVLEIAVGNHQFDDAADVSGDGMGDNTMTATVHNPDRWWNAFGRSAIKWR